MIDLIQNAPVLYFLVATVTGFIAGFGAYRAIIKVGVHDIVRKGSYILKSDIVGNLIRSEALQELDHLIELGGKIDGTKLAEAVNFMTRVHTFVHYLDLPKELNIGEDKFSFAEELIDHIIRDIPNTGQTPKSNQEKIFQIIGVVKGLRSSLSSNAGY